LAIPIARIATVEAWRFSRGRTVLVVVGVGISVALVWAAVTLAGLAMSGPAEEWSAVPADPAQAALGIASFANRGHCHDSPQRG